ncbi:MAG: exosortase E/protease, VPEID-CTERM system [Acidobacteria bacterium]|nr:exosortase E/protease, VPEID-CTERM system [Acidobacteriota bacterium]
MSYPSAPVNPLQTFTGSLSARLGLMTLTLLLEIAIISVWVDNAQLSRDGLIVGIVAQWGATVVRAVVAFALFWIVFGQAGAGTALEAIRHRLADQPVRWVLAPWHGLALAAFGALSQQLYWSGQTGNLLPAVWIAGGVAVLVTLAIVFAPWPVWRALLASTVDVWGFGLGATIVAVALTRAARALWEPVSSLTFEFAAALLRLTMLPVRSNPVLRELGTDRFQVEIAAECSGLEGVALVLVFGAAWLWFFRSEYRFPHALLLLPAGMAAIWVLNTLRIAALIGIGHAGWESVALGGFHSQAGWITFVSVSLAICWASRRLPWFASGSREGSLVASTVAKDTAEGDWTAPWLVPFLAILGAGLVSRASTGGFEWLYPLRVIAAGAALWLLRNEYRKISWRLSWAAPAAGVAVFALWLGLERLWPQAPDAALSSALAALPVLPRAAWLCFRVLGAVVTVPVAEELAFRGFLMRRLSSARFTQVDPTLFRAFAWLASSTAFGLLHGERWLAGTLAGLIYAWAYSRRGSIGDAAAAHGITNGLLALWVLTTGETQLW